MADGPKLRSPVVRVVMDDGAEWEVQTLNPDLLQWDWTSTRHRWGTAEQLPMVWLTFIGWAASKREGLTALTWEDFQKHAVEVATTEAEPPAVDPTNRDPEDD